MKNIVFFIFSIFMICSCNKDTYHVEEIPMDSEVGLALAAQLEPLCELTGLTIVKPMYECLEIKDSGYTYYHCTAVLKYSDKPSEYRIRIDKNKRVFEFYPLESFITEYYLGYDLLPSGPEREKVLDTVNRVNEVMGNRYFGEAAVQKAGEYYVVSFLAIPEDEIRQIQKKGEVIIDPYFIFFLTEDMKVRSVICRSWCFRQMEKDE